MFGLCLVGAILGAAGSVLLLWGLAYRRLAYYMTDNALRIEWLGSSLVVPYPAVQGIYTGQRLAGNATPRGSAGRASTSAPARVRGLGPLRFFATSTDQSSSRSSRLTTAA